MRDIDRPPPGDPTGSRKTKLHPELSKKRSAYFETEFAAANRDPDPVRARIHNEAIVMADLRTNVIVSSSVRHSLHRTSILMQYYRSKTSFLL